MSSEWELDDGIKPIKSAWRREHTARVNLEKMLQQAETENAKLRELCADIYKGFRGVVFEGWSYSSEDFRMYERYMRKLGIEVKA